MLLISITGEHICRIGSKNLIKTIIKNSIENLLFTNVALYQMYEIRRLISIYKLVPTRYITNITRFYIKDPDSHIEKYCENFEIINIDNTVSDNVIIPISVYYYTDIPLDNSFSFYDEILSNY
jgi:hypothetical protein